MTSESKIKSFRTQLEECARSQGIDLFGIADLDGPGVPHHHSIDNVLCKMNRGIALAVALPRAVLDDIDDAPTTLYAHAYKTANWILDQTALRLVNRIQSEGYQALSIGASQIIDWVHQHGHISHRAVAQIAGLGSRGYSGLLITPQYGAQVRLTTILTNMPLTPDKPADSMSPKCKKCGACIKVCPATAISPNRLDRSACYAQLKYFEKAQGVGKLICGICIKVCRGNQE